MRYLVAVCAAGVMGVAAVDVVNVFAEQPRRGGVEERALEKDPERDRAMLKARLESRLAETRQVEERLESALQRLDAGAPVADVRASLELPGEHRELRRPAGLPLWRESRQRLSDEERAALAAYMQEHAPELAGRLRALQGEHPMLADRMLSRTGPRLRMMIAEEDGAMRELRRREVRASWDVLAATRNYAEALRTDEESPRTEELAGALREELRRHFDLRQAMHQREIELLEERLGELRAQMEEHQAKRDEHVERRVGGVIRAVRERDDGESGEK